METVKVVWILMLLAFVVGGLSGCSIKAEFGYHGKTGRDDQTVTENFRASKGGRY